LKNHNFIFLIILFSVAIAASTLFVTNDVSAQTANANQTVAITTTIDPITILTNELMPLLDTSAIGNLTSLTVTTNLPCDTSNVPKLKIIAGILSNTTNVIDSSSDYTNNKGPRDTCLFTDKITNVTAKGIPAMNRVFLKNTGSTPVHIPEGVMVTLTGIFGKSILTQSITPPDFQDDYTTSSGWTTQAGTLVTVNSNDSNRVDFSAIPANADHRVSKSLGLTLSDTNWTAEFELNVSSMTTGSQAPVFLLSAGTSKPRENQDSVAVWIQNTGVGTKIATFRNDGGSMTTSSVLTILTGTTYYITFERTDTTTLKLSVYTDPDRSQNISGSPSTIDISGYTITGLTTLQHTSDDGGGTGTISATIDNTKIWNNSNP